MTARNALTAAIAILATAGLCGGVLADAPSKTGDSQFAMTTPFIDVGIPDLASCTDADEDDQCDNSIAFITKTGHWGLRISGVESDGAGPYRVCMTFWDTVASEWGALLLAEDLFPAGPKNTLSAGGDVYADTQEWLDVVYLPGFAVMRHDAINPTGCHGHLIEFMSGVRVY